MLYGRLPTILKGAGKGRRNQNLSASAWCTVKPRANEVSQVAAV